MDGNQEIRLGCWRASAHSLAALPSAVRRCQRASLTIHSALCVRVFPPLSSFRGLVKGAANLPGSVSLFSPCDGWSLSLLFLCLIRGSGQSEDPEEGDEDCSHPPFMPHRSYQSLTPPRILSTVWMECPHSFNALIFCWIFHNTRDSMHYHFAIRVKWQKKILKGTPAERRTYVYDSRRLSPQAWDSSWPIFSWS